MVNNDTPPLVVITYIHYIYATFLQLKDTKKIIKKLLKKKIKKKKKMNSKSVRKSFVKLDPKVFENDTSYKNVLAKNNPTPHASIELISNIDQDEFGEKISHHQRKNSQSSDSTCSSSSSSYTE